MNALPPPDTGLNAAVAEVLNGERAAADMTFDDLAAAQPQISRRQLMRLLSSKEAHVDVAALETLAAVFGMSPDQVVARAVERMSRVVPDPRQATSPLMKAKTPSKKK